MWTTSQLGNLFVIREDGHGGIRITGWPMLWRVERIDDDACASRRRTEERTEEFAGVLALKPTEAQMAWRCERLRMRKAAAMATVSASRYRTVA